MSQFICAVLVETLGIMGSSSLYFPSLCKGRNNVLHGENDEAHIL